MGVCDLGMMSLLGCSVGSSLLTLFLIHVHMSGRRSSTDVVLAFKMLSEFRFYSLSCSLLVPNKVLESSTLVGSSILALSRVPYSTSEASDDLQKHSSTIGPVLYDSGLNI